MAKNQSNESNEMAKTGETALALTDAAITEGFGGEDANQVPIEVSWPEVKMSKSVEFIMPDGSKAVEIVGHIVYAQRSKAYYEKAYDGNTDPPDCASSDAITPDFGDESQAKMCFDCPHAKWVKDSEGKSSIACKDSLNLFILVDGKTMPMYMRVRSTSIGKKSPLAKFFVNCIQTGYARGGKFQTVQVKLELDETKINNFATSILQIEKLSTLEATDKRLVDLMQAYKRVSDDFVVVHERGDTDSEQANGEYPGADDTTGDDIPV